MKKELLIVKSNRNYLLSFRREKGTKQTERTYGEMNLK